jgi:hypothetical protein
LFVPPTMLLTGIAKTRREPEFIFEPTALLRLWRRSKFVPVVVNFLLGVAVYDQRDCLPAEWRVQL